MVCLHAALHNPFARAAFRRPRLAIHLILLLLCACLFLFSECSVITKYPRLEFGYENADG